jgi:hypothetical protein
MNKLIIMLFALVFLATPLFAGPPTPPARTIKYGLGNKSYSTSFLGGKVNSTPYGRGYLNRTYNPSGKLIKTTVTVPYGSNGWLTR